MALIITQGLSDITPSTVESSLSTKFKDFVDTVYPFMVPERAAKDNQMKEMMKKEVAKGPISFTQTDQNMFKSVVKRLSVPDDFRKKLMDKVNTKKLKA